MKKTQEGSENTWGRSQKVNTLIDIEKYVLGLEGVLAHESGQITLPEVKHISEEINKWKWFLTIAKRLKL